MATRLVRRSTISLPLPSLFGVVEVGMSDSLEFGLGELADDLVDLVADLLVALERDHVGEAAALGNVDRRVGLAGVLSETYFTNSRTRT